MADDHEDFLNYNELEDRINILESWKLEMQSEIINRLLDQFANKINKDLRRYLPAVGKLVTDYDYFINKNEEKLK